MWLLAVLALLVGASCGRLEFEPQPVSDAGSVDGSPGDASDAALDGALVCSDIACSDTSSALTCNGRCLAFCNETVTYSEALARCGAWGGTPISIRSQLDQDCMEDNAMWGWIGFVQPTASADRDVGWAWVDGSPASYLHWGSNEPSDGTDSLENDEEQCAHTYSTSAFWNDRPCDGTPQAIMCVR